MKTIYGLTALLAISAAASLMACTADPGSSGDTAAIDEARVAEAASAVRSVRTLGPAGGRVRAYYGPGTNFGIAYTIRAGEHVIIICHARGQSVEGNDIWYKMDTGYWIPDARVLTGTRSAVEPPCIGE